MAIIVVVEVDVVDVVELAVTGSHKENLNLKTTTNHMFVTASSLMMELNHNNNCYDFNQLKKLMTVSNFRHCFVCVSMRQIRMPTQVGIVLDGLRKSK